MVVCVRLRTFLFVMHFPYDFCPSFVSRRIASHASVRTDDGRVLRSVAATPDSTLESVSVRPRPARRPTPRARHRISPRPPPSAAPAPRPWPCGLRAHIVPHPHAIMPTSESRRQGSRGQSRALKAQWQRGQCTRIGHRIVVPQFASADIRSCSHPPHVARPACRCTSCPAFKAVRRA